MIYGTIPLSETHPNATLHTYVLDDSPRHDAEAARPAVLVLPADDAFVGAGKAAFAASEFAAMGYHAFELRYSAGTPALAPPPFGDAFTAIAWIRDHAEAYRIDPEKLLVCGFSAEGHLIAGLMTGWRDEGILTRVEQGQARAKPREDGAEEDGAEEDGNPKQYYENIYHNRAGMFCHTPFALEQRLVKYVMEGDEKGALDALGQINSQNVKAVLAKDPLRSAQNSIICSCTFLTRSAIQAGTPDEEAFALSDAVIRYIETLTDAKTVLAYEPIMLLQVIRLVKQYSGKHYSAPVRKALHYINSHLDQPLKLRDAASYAKVHPNYLSKRFKQETGNTVSRYALTRKIRESSYFVKHSDYSIAEIAFLYGFSGQSYYIASFKKVMGMPPGEYRNKHVGG
jgi:AraC-like DNA-binding protein